VNDRIDMVLEDAPGVRRPQDPARAQQQRGADLPLEPLQAAGHPGLAHLVELCDLGNGGPIGDLLEVAESFGIHVL
jgi:hypothetical protein